MSVPRAEPRIPVPGVDPAVRAAIGALAAVAAPVLIVAGPPAAGLACAVLAVVALAPRALTTGPEGDPTDARWTPVTPTELDRLRALGLARWRWRRDPWHAASAPGAATLAVVLLLGGLAAAAGLVLAAPLGAAPRELAALLALAAGVALVPPLLVGARRTGEPAGLWRDLRQVAALSAGAAARPDPLARLVPELRLAPTGDDGAVPAAVRLEVVFSGAPPFLRGLRLEPVARGFVPVLALAAEPAVQRALAARPDVAITARPDGLEVRLAAGGDALARSLALVAAFGATAVTTPGTLSPA